MMSMKLLLFLSVVSVTTAMSVRNHRGDNSQVRYLKSADDDDQLALPQLNRLGNILENVAKLTYDLMGKEYPLPDIKVIAESRYEGQQLNENEGVSEIQESAEAPPMKAAIYKENDKFLGNIKQFSDVLERFLKLFSELHGKQYHNSENADVNPTAKNVSSDENINNTSTQTGSNIPTVSTESEISTGTTIETPEHSKEVESTTLPENDVTSASKKKVKPNESDEK